MPRKWLAGGLALIVLGAAGGYIWRSARQRSQTPQPNPDRKQAQAPQPSVIPTETEVTLLGKIQATNIVNVGAPFEGTVDRYLVDAGEEVFEGEVLALVKNAGLDAAHQAAQVDAARAQSRINDLESQLGASRLEASRARSDAIRAKGEYERTQKVYQRQQLLVEAGATPRLTFEKSKKDFEDARSAYEGLDTLAQNAEDHVESLVKDLRNAKTAAESKAKELDNADTQIASGEVRSPVNGLLIARRGQAGDPVDPGMKDLLQIAVDLSALQVVLDPDPRVLPQIRQGQPAQIQVAEAASAIQGTVREVKTGRVFVDFTSPSAVIKPGLTAQVKIKLG